MNISSFHIHPYSPAAVCGTKDIAAIMSSSGTTGAPKGVKHWFYIFMSISFNYISTYCIRNILSPQELVYRTLLY